MSRSLFVCALLMFASTNARWAYCYDSKGISALEALARKAEKQYGAGAKSSLSIRVEKASKNNEDVYYFLSGLEIVAPDGNFLQLTVLAYNEHFFHKRFPEMSKLSTEVLLANFPILPETMPRVVDIIRSSKNRIVKIALTIAIRNTVILSYDSIRFLSEQIRVAEGELLSATLLAITPHISDVRFVALSNIDLKPVIDALLDLASRGISPLSALLIEAMLSRAPYVVYFAFLGELSPYGAESVRLLRTTAQIPSRNALEEAARSHFRSVVLR